MRQSLREGGLPFDAKMKYPNTDILQALYEAEKLVADTGFKRYNVEDALAELKK